MPAPIPELAPVTRARWFLSTLDRASDTSGTADFGSFIVSPRPTDYPKNVPPRAVRDRRRMKARRGSARPQLAQRVARPRPERDLYRDLIRTADVVIRGAVLLACAP